MRLLASGLSGTIGRKMDKSFEPAQVILGTTKLRDHIQKQKEPVALVHLAGIVGESKVKEDLAHSQKINVDETFLLAREVIEDFNGKFIHISSSHIYGPSISILNEESSYNPQSHYATQKVLAEQKLTDYFGKDNHRLVILRVFSVLGWEVDDFTLGGLVRRVMAGSKETISFSDDVRDFMTPTSIAGAISKIAKIDDISGIYNLSTGVGIKVSDAVRSMFEVMKIHEPYGQLTPGNSLVPYLVGDNQKLLATGVNVDLLWNPTNDLPTSIGSSAKGNVS
jgi:nucleoside-diphosphate-sugar epimerase